MTNLFKLVSAVILVLFLSGLLVWFFERRRNERMFGGSAVSGLGAGLWWAAVTMTTVGYGDKAPVTVGGRLVALWWMFASLVIIASLTAVITSALTVSQLSYSIHGPEDLIAGQQRVGSVDQTSSADWLAEHRIPFVSYPRVADALSALQAGRLTAVVYDAPILRYQLAKADHPELVVLPRHFQLQHYAFALPAGSALREPVNRAILDIFGDTEWVDAIYRHTGAVP